MAFAVTASVSARPAQATNFGWNFDICNILPWLPQCDDNEPEPTVTPSPSPTPTETPEESPNPCDGEILLKTLEVDPCATPTPEPTSEPESTPSGFIALTPAGAPVCDGVPFVKLPANVHVYRNGASAEVKWVPTQGSEAHIYYFQNQNPSNAHALRDIANDGQETINLLGNLDWTFGVQQKDGCATSGTVYIVDGNEPQLFRFNYVW